MRPDAYERNLEAVMMAGKVIQMVYEVGPAPVVTEAESQMLDTLGLLMQGDVELVALDGVFYGWGGDGIERSVLITPGDPLLEELISLWGGIFFLAHEMTHGARFKFGLDDCTYEGAIESELVAGENEILLFRRLLPVIRRNRASEDPWVKQVARSARRYKKDRPRWIKGMVRQALRSNDHYIELPRRQR